MKRKAFILLLLLISVISNNVYGNNFVLQVQSNQTQYSVCANLRFEDTLTIIAPESFIGLSPVWRFNNDSVSIGDSLIFTNVSFRFLPLSIENPQTNESINFHVSMNYQLSSFSLPVYVADGNGIFNSRRDTLWRCSDSLKLGLSIPLCGRCGDQLYSGLNFYNQYGFVSDISGIVTEDGLYYFKASNDCYSVNFDSIHVISQAYEVPRWNDTTFCNSNVDLVRDCGSGWNFTNWSNGNQNSAIHISSAGEYTVQVSSICLSASSSFNVFQAEVPAPSFSGYQSGSLLCSDSIVVLDPNPGYSYDTYLWNTGSTDSQILVSEHNGEYSVTVSKFTCVFNSSIELSFFGRPLKNNISYLTYDNATGRNKIVWKSQQTIFQDTIQRLPVDYYEIYVSSAGTPWTLLSSILAGQWNEYFDYFSNPQSGYFKYKIVAKDQCGALGEFSDFISSIFLQIVPMGESGHIKLEWNHCYGENGIFLPIKYYIYKENNADGFQLYDSIPGTENEYYDFNSSSLTKFQVLGVYDQSCFSTIEAANIYSNISILSMDEIGEDSKASLILYPNPTTQFVYIEGSDDYKFKLYNSIGQKVKDGDIENSRIDMFEYSNGLYILEIEQRDRNKYFTIEKR